MSNQFQQFADAVSDITAMTDSALVQLQRIGQHISFQEGEQYLEAGQQASHVGFILSGAVREFFITREGKEYKYRNNKAPVEIKFPD